VLFLKSLTYQFGATTASVAAPPLTECAIGGFVAPSLGFLADYIATAIAAAVAVAAVAAPLGGTGNGEAGNEAFRHNRDKAGREREAQEPAVVVLHLVFRHFRETLAVNQSAYYCHSAFLQSLELLQFREHRCRCFQRFGNLSQFPPLSSQFL
jgi:hypothetical protein